MEKLKNIIIDQASENVFTLYSTEIIPDHTVVEDKTIFLNRDLLSPDLGELIQATIAIPELVPVGSTLSKIQYQNISQSFTGYERFWVISEKDGEQYSVQATFIEVEGAFLLPLSLQQEVLEFSQKLIQTIIENA